jgi:hypothetical protein
MLQYKDLSKQSKVILWTSIISTVIHLLISTRISIVSTIIAFLIIVSLFIYINEYTVKKNHDNIAWIITFFYVGSLLAAIPNLLKHNRVYNF